MWAWQYVIENDGISQEKDYPYVAKDQPCKANRALRQTKLKSFQQVSDSDRAIKIAICQMPVAAAVDATKWTYYKGGLVTDCGKNVNHAATVVGYKED